MVGREMNALIGT